MKNKTLEMSKDVINGFIIQTFNNTGCGLKEIKAAVETIYDINISNTYISKCIAEYLKSKI